jgi:hypothetical protein
MIVASLESFRGRDVSKKEPVPEGLGDRSQAIYCLELVVEKIRPGGHGMIPEPETYSAGKRSKTQNSSLATKRDSNCTTVRAYLSQGQSNHTVPYGTD